MDPFSQVATDALSDEVNLAYLAPASVLARNDDHLRWDFPPVFDGDAVDDDEHPLNLVARIASAMTPGLANASLAYLAICLLLSQRPKALNISGAMPALAMRCAPVARIECPVTLSIGAPKCRPYAFNTETMASFVSCCRSGPATK